MAYLPQDENQQQQQQDGATQEKVIAGQSAAMPSSTGGSAPGASSGAAKPGRSGVFTNLMNYVGANEGNDAKMGEAVKSNVQSAASDASTKTQAWQNKASSAASAGAVQKDQTVIDSLNKAPTQVDKQAFNQQYNATYKGPQDATREVQGFDDAAQAYNRVDTKVQQAQGDLNQRTGLLEDVYGRPSYNAGEKKLDSFLLGTGQGGKAAINDIKTNFSNARSNLDSAKSAVDSQIAQAKQTTDATRQAAQQAYNQAVTNKQNVFTSASQQAAADNERRRAELAQAQAEAERFIGYDSDSQIDVLKNNYGFSEADARRLTKYGTGDDVFRNLFQYAGDKTDADFISQQDQADYAALMDLIGAQPAREFQRSSVGDAGVARNVEAISRLLADATATESRALTEAQTAAELRRQQEEAAALAAQQQAADEAARAQAERDAIAQTGTTSTGTSTATADGARAATQDPIFKVLRDIGVFN